MKPNEIRAAMLARGIRPVDIARKLKISRQQVTNVIYGRGKSRRIQEEIATEIGEPVEKIWPQWAA